MRAFTNKPRWIGIDEGRHDAVLVSPAMQLRKQFNYEKKGKAECLICGLGVYVLYINGKRVSDDVLSPAFTAYDLRALRALRRQRLFA